MAKTTSISDDEPIRFEKKPRQKVRIRVFRSSPQQFFEEGFRKIAATRMKGVPICNPRLSVSSVPFRKVDGQWVGGVVTPWSLLVIRACGDPETWTNIAETKVKGVELPGGEFSFMGVVDPDLGVYQSCSLLSPTRPRRSCASHLTRCSRLRIRTRRSPSPNSESRSPCKSPFRRFPKK